MAVQTMTPPASTLRLVLPTLFVDVLMPVVLFDVPSNEALHAHLNAWADIIPARFEVHALIDPANARRFLDEQGAAV